MNITIIGSCLSFLVLKKYSLLAPASTLYKPAWNHLRSDALLDILTQKGICLPSSLLTEYVHNYFNRPEIHHNRVMAQRHEKLKNFKEYIKKTNMIIMDNNYDLAALGCQFLVNEEKKQWSIQYSFGDMQPRDDPKIKKTPRLTYEKSIENYQLFFSALREINPTIKIVFINYPITGFIKQSKNLYRIEQAQKFAKYFIDKEALIIPLIDIEFSSLSSKGSRYFEEDVHILFAEYIHAVLEKKCTALDPNEQYSQQELREVVNLMKSVNTGNTNPYKNLPSINYWRTAVADHFMLSIGSLYKKRFEIKDTDKIVTCGSCFAQHIGNRLQQKRFNYYDVEPAPSSLGMAEWHKQGYGIYSARYGNVYTTKQLDELFDQAQNNTSLIEVWKKNDRWYDPFRPNIIENGFGSKEEAIEARAEHLNKVYEMFKTLDIFIFTLGLTESWYHSKYGYTYPICPGTTVGKFNPEIHKFINLSFSKNWQALKSFYLKLMAINPKAKLILTVSPVPLVATFEKRHVLLSTMESKSILRAVAGEMVSRYKNVDYFPSYEIISSHPFKGFFYEENLRTVRKEGVDFVMQHFFSEHNTFAAENVNTVEQEDNEAFCDEVFLDMV